MTWLFIQLWFLMLLAFLAGAVMTYVVISRLVPHVDRLETDPHHEGDH
jgi:hypothetical protein